MAMKTSNTNIELSNDIKISDSVVKAVVEKILSSAQSDEILDIVINYLRGYLEKIMDNPEIIVNNEERLVSTIDKRVFGDFNLMQRLHNIETAITNINSVITGNNIYWNSNQEFFCNSPLRDIASEIADIKCRIDMLKNEFYMLQNQIP